MTLRFILAGQNADGGVEHGFGEKVVLKLPRHIEECYHQVFCDNFFTTCNLLELLLERKIYAYGTARQDRRGFPDELKVLQLQQGESWPPLEKHKHSQPPHHLCHHQTMMVLHWRKHLKLHYIYLHTEQAANVCIAIAIALQHGGERRCGTAMSALDNFLFVFVWKTKWE